MPRRPPARLLIAASEHNADILYATRFFAPDPFTLLVQNGRSTVLLSDLEVDRGRKQARVDEVISFSEFAKQEERALGKKPPFARVIARFLALRGARRVLVPADFPLGLARDLGLAGINVRAAKGAFWPERERKTAEELQHLRRALKITATGLARAMEVLQAADAPSPRGPLRWAGAVLTSERLRAEIESAILRAGGEPARTIVAGGEQACDPHERGFGPLRAGELIILDVFPRDARSGYFGDMTRTVVKGAATDAQRKLWDTVRAGQKMGIDGLRAGRNGVRLDESIKSFFKERGYPTEQRDGRWRGFFHGLGHGLGLDLHEEPRLNRTRTFAAGQVFTVEPGLYYPELGGVRIEDGAAVTADGPAQVLSRFAKQLEV